jgi:Protein of unknown function (DUF3050)
MQASIDISEEIADARRRLIEHPLYEEVNSVERLRTFMSHHVFAVWDFFSLAKRLQQLVTCVEVPWLPPADATSARLINDIVMSEESDVDQDGGYASHFDLHRSAMQELGADHSAIDAYLDRLRRGEHAMQALDAEELPANVAEFVGYDMRLALDGKPHEVASAFCFGREDLIPDMFSELVRPIAVATPELEGSRIKYYIDRHIILDSHEHAPLARRLVGLLCGNDNVKWREAAQVAVGALEARIRLWDGVLEDLVVLSTS